MPLSVTNIVSLFSSVRLKARDCSTGLEKTHPKRVRIFPIINHQSHLPRLARPN